MAPQCHPLVEGETDAAFGVAGAGHAAFVVAVAVLAAAVDAAVGGAVDVVVVETVVAVLASQWQHLGIRVVDLCGVQISDLYCQQIAETW